MAAASALPSSDRCAVVTGANKGIGLEICRQLASKGVKVVLTARDEKRGLEAVEKLKSSGLSDHLIFHQLDVADSTSINSLADFIRTKFGRLDILVNNAGVSGVLLKADASKTLREAFDGGEAVWSKLNWSEAMTQTYELAEECLKINYYGAKRMAEAFIPLLQLSNSPRIVNVSSSMGKLRRVRNEWAKGILNDVESLAEERVDEVLHKFLRDFNDGPTATNWPVAYAAYIVSKAAMNAYTRILAKKYPNILINCLCPGYVKTDINENSGIFTVEEGAEGPVKSVLLPDGGPSGLFFFRTEESSFE